VIAVAFSPAGRRVTGASRYTTPVWDSSSGKPATPLDLQHSKVTTHAVIAAAFSANGGHIVTVVQDTVANAARVFNATTGEPVDDDFTHQGGVTATALSPDGRRVVTASGESARIWDAATGQPVGAALQHEGAIKAAAFSFDGLRVVTASEDNTARIWDAATGQPIGGALRHRGHVLAVAFSPDGRRVVTASSDHTARVWQVLLDFSSREIFELLPDLAELQGGYRVTSLGSVTRLGEGERSDLVHRLNGVATGVAPVDVLLRRFLGSSQ
jgi:WD40 repeat protein